MGLAVIVGVTVGTALLGTLVDGRDVGPLLGLLVGSEEGDLEAAVGSPDGS